MPVAEYVATGCPACSTATPTVYLADDGSDRWDCECGEYGSLIDAIILGEPAVENAWEAAQWLVASGRLSANVLAAQIERL